MLSITFTNIVKETIVTTTNPVYSSASIPVSFSLAILIHPAILAVIKMIIMRTLVEWLGMPFFVLE